MDSKLQKLLDGYAQDHQHPVNLKIHKVGVPLVLFHFVAMFDWVHIYHSFMIVTHTHDGFVFSLGHVIAFLIFGWYLSLSVKLACIVGVFSIYSKARRGRWRQDMVGGKAQSAKASGRRLNDF